MSNIVDQVWFNELYDYGGYPMSRDEIFKHLRSQGYNEDQIDRMLNNYCLNEKPLGYKTKKKTLFKDVYNLRMRKAAKREMKVVN